MLIYSVQVCVSLTNITVDVVAFWSFGFCEELKDIRQEQQKSYVEDSGVIITSDNPLK